MAFKDILGICIFGRGNYFKLDGGRILWLMTDEYAEINQFDEIPERCEEVFDALSDSSARARWGLTEIDAQVFEVVLRGQCSIQRKIHYSGEKIDEVSKHMQWKAPKNAADEMLLAQQEGVGAVTKCLEKYRTKKM